MSLNEGYLLIQIGKNEIEIQKNTFVRLFENNIGNEDIIYLDSIKNNQISFLDLKKISYKYQIPYPLFFADSRVIDFQLKEFNKKIIDKLPIKDEIFYNSRSSKLKNFNPLDILLIIKDISRKQLFLKKIQKPEKNIFVGYIKKYKDCSIEKQAEYIRSYFGISVEDIKKLPKKKSAIEYLIEKIEKKNIFISFSSHNFMPQSINPDLEFSGFCIKDKYYPWIFINNKDNQSKPQIYESDGRKILTIIYILCNISRNYFSELKKGLKINYMFDLSLEILLPKSEINNITIHKYDDLILYSNIYKVTPSLFLERLKLLKIIEPKLYKNLREEIKKNRESIENHSFGKGFSHVNRYAKYNGNEFSHQAVKIYKTNLAKDYEIKNILFKGRKITNSIFTNYCKRFDY